MRAAVLGATGFVGRALVPALAERGEVVAVSRRTTEPELAGVRSVAADLTDGESTRGALSRAPTSPITSSTRSARATSPSSICGWPRRAQDCSELPAPKVAGSPTAIAQWMTRLPGVNATTARPVEVSGFRGVVLDLSMAKGWKKTCSWSGDTPVVLLIVGVPPSGLTHGLIPGLALRLYLLRHDNATLAIEVDDVSGGKHLTNYAAVVKQIRLAH